MTFQDELSSIASDHEDQKSQMLEDDYEKE